MTSRIVVAIRVKATPDQAFAAFTGQIGQWWRPNGMFAFTPRDPGEMAFESGPDGRLVERLANGKVFEVGKILAWAPPTHLAFGWRQATFAEGQDTRVDVRFEAVGEETRVSVEHVGWDSIPDNHVARHGFAESLFLRRHAEWWRDLLSSYKAAL